MRTWGDVTQGATRTVAWIFIGLFWALALIGALAAVTWVFQHFMLIGVQTSEAIQPAEIVMADPTEAEIVRFITEESYRVGIRPAWARKVAWNESRWQPRPPDSSAGAKGLFQLMPWTIKVLHVSDPYDYRQSTIAGTGLLAAYLKICGTEERALEGYATGSCK